MVPDSRLSRIAGRFQVASDIRHDNGQAGATGRSMFGKDGRKMRRSSPSRGSGGKLEGVFDEIDSRRLTWDEEHLGDVEAAGDSGIAEQPQPSQRAALDEPLFVRCDGVSRAAKAGAGAGFDFDEGEDGAVARDDIHFTAIWPTVV